jgi:hypothetical protein
MITATAFLIYLVGFWFGMGLFWCRSSCTPRRRLPHAAVLTVVRSVS